MRVVAKRLPVFYLLSRKIMHDDKGSTSIAMPISPPTAEAETDAGTASFRSRSVFWGIRVSFPTVIACGIMDFLFYCFMPAYFFALCAHGKYHHDGLSLSRQVSHARRSVAVPTTSNFVMRGFHSCAESPRSSDVSILNMMAATVLGDYLYIDGGELAQLVDGKLEIYPGTLKKTWRRSAEDLGLT